MDERKLSARGDSAIRSFFFAFWFHDDSGRFVVDFEPTITHAARIGVADAENQGVAELIECNGEYPLRAPFCRQAGR